MTNLNYLEADAALVVACLPEELTPEIQALDQPFLEAIREAAMVREEGVAVWLRQD